MSLPFGSSCPCQWKKRVAELVRLGANTTGNSVKRQKADYYPLLRVRGDNHIVLEGNSILSHRCFLLISVPSPTDPVGMGMALSTVEHVTLWPISTRTFPVTGLARRCWPVGSGFALFLIAPRERVEGGRQSALGWMLKVWEFPGIPSGPARALTVDLTKWQISSGMPDSIPSLLPSHERSQRLLTAS